MWGVITCPINSTSGYDYFRILWDQRPSPRNWLRRIMSCGVTSCVLVHNGIRFIEICCNRRDFLSRTSTNSKASFEAALTINRISLQPMTRDVHGSVHGKLIFEYNQQEATLHNLFISVKCSTCFRRFLRPLSGAQKLYIRHRVLCQTFSATCHCRGWVGVPMTCLCLFTY